MKFWDFPDNSWFYRIQVFSCSAAQEAPMGVLCALFLFLKGHFYKCWRNFHFVGRIERYAIILWSFDISLILLNFLRSYVLGLGRSASCEATRIYQLINNNYVSFHSWWKENLLNHQKVSSYYNHDCLWKFSFALIVKN